MFDADLRGRKVSVGRIGTPAAISIAAHVAVLVIVVHSCSRANERVSKTRDVVFKQAPPMAAALSPTDSPQPPALPEPKIDEPKKHASIKKPEAIVEPAREPTPKIEAKEPAKPSSDSNGEANGVPGGQRGGDAQNGAPNGAPNGVAGAPSGVPGGVMAIPATTAQPTFATIPFGEGMTRPSLIAGPAKPRYTREAREAKVEGKILARCTITTAGTLVDCRILKSLPFLEQSVLETLAQQRYTPVMYQGHAQSVYYTLPFTFTLQ